VALAESPLGHAQRAPRKRSQAIAGLTVVVALACAMAAGAVLTGREASVQSWEQPREVTTLVLAADALWAGEPSSDSLLRLDPDGGRATARLAVGERARAVDHRLWVLDDTQHRLTVVDPVSGTVTARVALTSPDGDPYKGFDAFPSGRSIWVPDSFGALLLDRTSFSHRRRVTLAHDGVQADMWAPAGRAVWTVRGDGSVERFDGTSGRRTMRVPPVVSGPSIRLLADARGVVLLARDGSIVQLDPGTGDVMWRTRLQPPANGATLAGHQLAVQSQHPSQPHDRLTILSRDDGRRLAEVNLPVIGSTSTTASTSHVWISAPGGHLLSVRLPGTDPGRHGS
jgi:hypothetical protein